jgi:hypothetical protein
MTTRENIKLGEEQKRKVSKLVEERGVACQGCGSTDFAVGDALQLGRLWFNEEHGAYMVGLRCEEPGCRELTGIRLHRSEFLDEQ